MHNGTKIFKHYLTRKDRLIFSWVTCPDYNQNKPFLLIYNIIFEHDHALKRYLKENLGKNSELFDSPIENADPKADPIDSFIGTLGSGPTKPLPGDIDEESLKNLDLPHNIALDRTQREAIVQDQPLLIDGLAGTAKQQYCRDEVRLGLAIRLKTLRSYSSLQTMEL